MSHKFVSHKIGYKFILHGMISQAIVEVDAVRIRGQGSADVGLDPGEKPIVVGHAPAIFSVSQSDDVGEILIAAAGGWRR